MSLALQTSSAAAALVTSRSTGLCHPYDTANFTATVEDAHEEVVIATVHVVSSIISALCCTVVLIVSMRVPSLRRFPANMLLWKTACDLITSIVLASMNIALLVEGPQNAVVRGADMCANGLLAGLTGFCLLASPGWFFALAYNLNRSLHDPFTKPQSRMGKFHMWVWSTSLAAGLSAGGLHEYRPNLHMCYTCHGVPEVVNWLLLFGWLVAYWFLAVGFMIDAYYWMVHSRRVTERLSSRSSQLRSSILYVAIIGLQWALVTVVLLLIFEPAKQWEGYQLPRSRVGSRLLFAIVLVRRRPPPARAAAARRSRPPRAPATRAFVRASRLSPAVRHAMPRLPTRVASRACFGALAGLARGDGHGVVARDVAAGIP